MAFDHVGYFVKDLDLTREFYTEVFGGEVSSRPSPHFLEMIIEGTKFHFVADAEKSKLNSPSSGHVCLSVSSLERLQQIRNAAARSPLARNQSLEIIDSPPLSENKNTHVETQPPLKTLYMFDPDQLSIEIRTY